ncbi:MAG: radical SAM protein [Deltaproteobacteria bacterium]|nr:radical SAM protein [Deltaproteobacteria bacterium]
MKVLLVSANTESINLPTFPLGLACVAQATLKAGHEVECLDLIGVKQPDALLKKTMGAFKPGVIGISVRNIDDQNIAGPRFLLQQAKQVVAACKEFSGAPVVVGGAGYSLFPQKALDYLEADIGIQGEGEEAFPLLLDHMKKGLLFSHLPGLYLYGSGSCEGNRRFTRDLDRFPLPNPKILSTAAYEGEDFYIPVQTRRGCPMKCSYCSTEIIEGRFIRKRSPEVVVRSLARWVDAGFRRFQFVDNTFNLPPSYAEALCDLLAESSCPIAWRCILYPGNLKESLVAAMAKAGCREVSLGFESGCDEMLKEMNKHFRAQDVRDASRMLSDHNISPMGFLMLGGPGETQRSVEESLAFVHDLNLDALKITIGVRIYPYTALAKIAVEEGLIAPDDDLLFPRFYLERGLEDWLRKTVEERIKENRAWMM